ncbi:nitrite reductase small subunit NirD [Streptomyces kunmingensis]|uniref:Nitrite reductase small subunit NirD n=1 Tax=Streptomyces kunmingensis TaxID=68225 RepID=A0ABU6CJ70_9ACTN|nr:nitrite reductase small subunit NirD [Streptomyces kunmingensis]MEB3964504.1 nitrite reductase small subunit NirD [Streptomyces kunmingensis]
MTMTTIAPEKTTLSVQLGLDGSWFTVCGLDRLTPGRGVAALLPDGRQAALFLDRAGRLYAVDNTDPFTGAAVLSRGLLGSASGRPFVASPLLKQRFDLETGRCLDDETTTVEAYAVRTA